MKIPTEPIAQQSSEPSREVADHLRALYGSDGGDAPGFLTIFTLPDRRTYWYPGDNLFGETPDEIASLAIGQHVYHGMALQKEPVAGRGTAENVLAIPGVWFDLDVCGPNHKATHYPHSRDEALEFLSTLAIEPTLIIDSGGGLQAHWLFHDLQIIESESDRAIAGLLSERVQKGIIARGQARGWQLDNTSDLARILRPAGTLNHKTEPAKAVRTVHRSNARYRPTDLVALCQPVAKPHDIPRPKHDTNGTPLDRRIEALLTKVGAQPEGNRDNTAFRLACWLVRDFALPDTDALAWLRRWNQSNQPPLPDAQLVGKLSSAKKSGKRPFNAASAA